MREVIDEILNGNYGSETGSLDFSQATLECTAFPGEELAGSFDVKGEGAAFVTGRVLSTDYRMECLTPDFAGTESRIDYVFHGEGMEPGETVKGAFRVISNVGEYSLPYVVNLSKQRADSTIGPVPNLNRFVRLAEENWREAVNFFYSDSFEEILSENDPSLIPAYRGLSAIYGQEQNVEAFLIAAGKKQPVEFTPSVATLTIETSQAEGEYQLLEQEITLMKSGWGYVALNVDCDGAFLHAEKEVLLEEDFEGNVSRFSFYVDAARLREGNHHGKIVFYNSFRSFEVEVNVKVGIAGSLAVARIAREDAIVAIMRKYELFRTRRIGLQSWLDQTDELVEKLMASDAKDPMPCLFKAQILITRDRQNEAKWMLSHAADLMDRWDPWKEELWAYYLYLTTLISREEEQILEVTDEVEAIYDRNPDSWRIAWLLLYLSADLSAIPSEKLRFLERQYEMGCRSFVIYLEALQIYLSNPATLRKLGAFERQVLCYGIRKDFFSPDLAERFMELMEKEKEYSPILCRILEKLYKKRKDDRIVRFICEAFVRGGILGKRALPWFEKGVEQQLRITNLYESFMASLDPQERKGLPKAAVLYFSYQNKLDYERSAFLYDYVLDNKVLFEDVYEKYVLKCRDFVAQQIDKGRINRHLARLYEKMLTPQTIKDHDPQAVLRILFSTRIKAKDVRMKKVILYAKGSSQGRECPLSGGETCVPVYGEETVIIFEDAFGNRFADAEKELERFLQPDSLIPYLLDRELKEPEFDLWFVNRHWDEETWEDEVAERALSLLAFGGLERERKKQIALRLMRLYFETDRPEKMDEVLGCFEGMELTQAERMEVAKYAVLRGNYALPFAWIREYGPYFLDANTLARLVGNVILNGCGQESAVTAAATYLFLRGKASAAILEYLSQYGEGTLKELRDLRKAMLENELDVTALEERILIQLTFTGGYVSERSEIFERYYAAAGETNVTRAYVIRGCFEYFVREKPADGILFRILQDDYKEGGNLPKICKLAFLKYYAENPAEVTREVDGTLDAFLREMMAERMHFDFYRKLRNQRHLLGELADKVIVEYRTRPGNKVRIHYVIHEEGESAKEYLAENMRDVFWGICCREFVLFFGEVLEYYVTEETDGEETMTVSGKVQCPETDPEAAGTKYGIVNDVATCHGMHDDGAMDEALEQYYFKEYCGENLFVLQ